MLQNIIKTKKKCMQKRNIQHVLEQKIYTSILLAGKTSATLIPPSWAEKALYRMGDVDVKRPCEHTIFYFFAYYFLS